MGVLEKFDWCPGEIW